MTRMSSAAVAAAFSIVAGCGGGGSGGGPSGVSGSKQVSSVTDAEKGILCDWFVGMIGGYGAPSTCADAVITAPPDKTECLTSFPSCAVTVSEFEDCVTRLVSAQDACTQEALTAAEAAASCQAVGTAGCFN